MATSFHRLQERSMKLAKILKELSGLDDHLINNLVVYCKSLARPEAPSEIEELMFTNQMMKQFNFTSSNILSLMFGVIRCSKTNYTTVEEYCRLISTFLCSDLDLKISYVFKVYDLNGDGVLSYSEICYFLRPCIIFNDLEDVDTEDAVRELTDIVLKITDLDENGVIDLIEFRRLVKNNPLYLQLLGPCLPNDYHLEEFRQKLTKHTEQEVRHMFRHERKCQYSNEKGESLKYYPIELDLP